MPKILAIDDEQDVLDSLISVVEDQLPKCQVCTAGSGPEGLKKAKAELPDTILLDIRMPGIDGFEVCKRLKADKDTRYIPVIILTGVETDFESRVRALELGADLFLTKTFNVVELVTHINAMLKIKKSEDLLRQEKGLLEKAVEERTRALEESEKKFRQFFENGPNYCYMISPAGRILDVNMAALKVLGYKKEELVGKPLKMIYAPEVLPKTEELFPKWRKTGKLKDEELVIISKKGDRRTILLSATAVKDKDGKILHSISAQKDITEIKQAEDGLQKAHDELERRVEERTAELTRSNEQLKRQIKERLQAEEALRISDSAIAASINGIAFADPEGKVSYLNDSCLRLWGYENEEEVLGRPAIEFWKSEKKTSEVWKATLRDGSWIGELVAVRKDGTSFDVQMSATMITDKAGKPASIMASVVDITEQNKMREALVRSERLSSLGRFVAGLAHEIKNPLGVIGFSSDYCLKNMELESQVKEHLELISRNSERANKRIGDLLAFAKPSDMERKEFDINDVVNRMLEMARLEAHHSDITFVPKFRKRLPKLVGDEEKLGQVFFNLMRNAVQAVSGKGQVTVQTRFMASQDLIEVNVIDDGPGIPEENLGQIFDPFFTTKKSGTGLGLSICHTIVQQHKGSITFEYDKRGTRFAVRLPLNRD